MKTLDFFLAAFAPVLAAHPALAQEWPARPMTMVVPFAAGGSTDAIARIVADGLSSQLHQPVIVENIAGAGGMTGTNRVAKALPHRDPFLPTHGGTPTPHPFLPKKPLFQAPPRLSPP